MQLGNKINLYRNKIIITILMFYPNKYFRSGKDNDCVLNLTKLAFNIGFPLLLLDCMTSNR